jgi:hypothetical protein
LKAVNENKRTSDMRKARDRAHVLLEAMEFYREYLGNNDDSEMTEVCRACFKELSVSMSILEKAFVDSLEGNRLHKILKELILKMDNSLMDIKKKNINLINFGSEEIKKEVNVFYREFLAGTVKLKLR